MGPVGWARRMPRSWGDTERVGPRPPEARTPPYIIQYGVGWGRYHDPATHEARRVYQKGQDFVRAFGLRGENGEKVAIIAVADGVTRSLTDTRTGEPTDGGLAARTAVYNLEKLISRHSNPSTFTPDQLRNDIYRLNRMIERTHFTGQTTLSTAIVTEDGKIIWAAVGDSPLYVVIREETGGLRILTLNSQTSQHSPDGRLEAVLGGRNQTLPLDQAIRTGELRLPPSSEAWIIATSDGVNLTPEEVLQTVEENLRAHPPQIASALVAKATKRDDRAAAVIHITPNRPSADDTLRLPPISEIVEFFKPPDPPLRQFLQKAGRRLREALGLPPAKIGVELYLGGEPLLKEYKVTVETKDFGSIKTPEDAQIAQELLQTYLTYPLLEKGYLFLAIEELAREAQSRGTISKEELFTLLDTIRTLETASETGNPRALWTAGYATQNSQFPQRGRFQKIFLAITRLLNLRSNLGKEPSIRERLEALRAVAPSLRIEPIPAQNTE